MDGIQGNLQATQAVRQADGQSQGVTAGKRKRKAGAQEKGNASFGELLRQQTAEKSINFSRHAKARAEERGIELTESLMEKLAASTARAGEKGATNILAFDATQAFIINVPYGRVITTMSEAEMRENIFTNIDGAVLL